jgi:uncharacterized Zn-binding protein involved in type VI secretion
MHPLPPVLMPGIGSINVFIGFLPAWRGIPLAAVAALQAAKTASDTAIQVAEAATLAAAGTPGAPAALAAEQATKASCLASMSSAIQGAAACGADIHMCMTPLPLPPHGPGVVIDGSPTVMINNLPACRLGDTVLEALGPPNKIMKGEFTVIIGQSGSGGSSSGSGGAGSAVSVSPPNVSHIGASHDDAVTGSSSTVSQSFAPEDDGGGGAGGSGGGGGGSEAATQQQIATMQNASAAGTPMAEKCSQG